jgi:hypothetical protein
MTEESKDLTPDELRDGIIKLTKSLSGDVNSLCDSVEEIAETVNPATKGALRESPELQDNSLASEYIKKRLSR